MRRSAIQSLLENLRAALQSQGISQAELARRARIPQTTLNRIFHSLEHGVSPTLETVDRLAHGLKVSAAELLTDGVSSRLTSTDSPYLVARQIARLTEDFLLSSEVGRKEILRVAEDSAARNANEEH